LANTDQAEPTRRDFLYIATGAMGVVGAGALAWPFIDQMNPDASALALASIEVDVSAVEEGQSISVKWRGKPVFIRNRTDAEVEEANAVAVSDLPDPLARNANLPADAEATDVNRGIEGNEKLLVQVGICTHLGCVPVGDAGEYGGSARATARTTTPPAGSARARRLRTCSFRRLRWSARPPSRSANGTS
jgi:ubiquinol-cytochrome c reductase iron-sulfur subunit